MFSRLRFPLAMLALMVAALTLAGCAESGSDTRHQNDPERPIALVTGSTRGLGEELARRLSANGYHVIVHGRSIPRGEQLVEELLAAGGTAEFRRADFLELAQVAELADGLLADFDQLNLLINNAGIGAPEQGHGLTDDGVDKVLQVNYLAHFLLTERLMPLLEAGAPSRIINVSSGAQAPIDFDDPMLEQWEPDDRQIGRHYAQSKLAQILHAKDLAERLDPAQVTINALHPATFMDTYMVRQAGIEPQTDVHEGADRVMQLVTDEVGTGHYFQNGEITQPHEQALDPDARAALRELSLRLIEGF
ncbi:MAG: SDR family NAD(P)-dependent oxidoreductase [Wenzhouxiangella sp.]